MSRFVCCRLLLVVVGVAQLQVVRAASADVKSTLLQALALHASFDAGLDADFARGDAACYDLQGKELKKAEIDDREIARVEAIIKSMTPEERRDPSIMNGSRRLRVANGSGVTTSDVNALLKQFKDMQKMMRMLGRGGGGGKGRGPRLPSFN